MRVVRSRHSRSAGRRAAIIDGSALPYPYCYPLVLEVLSLSSAILLSAPLAIHDAQALRVSSSFVVAATKLRLTLGAWCKVVLLHSNSLVVGRSRSHVDVTTQTNSRGYLRVMQLASDENT